MRLVKGFLKFALVVTVATLIGGGLLWVLKPLIRDRFDSNLFSSALGIAVVFIFASYLINLMAYGIYFKRRNYKLVSRIGFCYFTSFILWLILQGTLSTIDIQSAIMFLLSISVGAGLIPLLNKVLEEKFK